MMQIKLLPRKIIGQTIHGIRMRLGMSAAEFAHSLGVADAGEIARWERGTVQPDYTTLAKIAAMGMVDALVFQEREPEGASPQLTPGEATELATILTRMEGLLADARALVDRATRRTAVELLEAATGNPPAQIVDSGALLLDAEVRLEAKPRTRSRTASGARRAAGTSPGRTTRSRGGGSSSRSTGSSSSASERSSNGSSARSGGSGASASRSRGGSSRSRSGSSRASSGSSSGGGSSSTTNQPAGASA